MGMKDKAMISLYLALKKRKANNRQSSSNIYDDDEHKSAAYTLIN